MRTIVSLLIVVLTATTSIAQIELDSLGHLNINSMHNCSLNDIWGYTDENGNEYALVGTTKGVSVVDVTDPSNPTEVFWASGLNSIWRDLKVYGDYAYITTEAHEGLTIIDLSPLPASTSLTVGNYQGTGGFWDSAHNLYIDENGYAYIFGANRGNGGVIILDVFTDPMNPSEVGTYDPYYVHDGFVRGDTMYVGHVNDGFFAMVNVSDKSNPILMGQHDTPNTFTHNVWPSDNGDFLFTTDEVTAGYVGSYDISDPSNITEIDRVQSSPGAGIIPHNAHVKGNFVVTSYYSDGVVVHDATYPYNLIEVGNYDTYPGQTTSYDGCWGVYPFFQSGTIVASDQTEGLFVLGSNYTQASYLEGIVTNSLTLTPINQVNVSVSGNSSAELTNSVGFYATGNAISGTYDVTYSKIGYYPQTISITLTSGVITTQDVQLVPIDQYLVDIEVLDAQTSAPIGGADVLFKGSLTTDYGVTNGLGQEQIALYYEEVYEVVAGKWGYETACMDIDLNVTSPVITLYLEKGIYDDFTFDFGWSANSNASTGDWVRDVPYVTGQNFTPQEDNAYDCSNQCYLTGNEATGDPDADDVDDGTVTLISPVMDLTSYSDPYIRYDRFFSVRWGGVNKDDTLYVIISNGATQVVLDQVGFNLSEGGFWHTKEFRISDFISVTSTMQVFFETSDLAGNPHVTEAAIDMFRILESGELSLSESNAEVLIYPNPANDRLFLEGVIPPAEFKILSLDGKQVEAGVIENSFVDVSLLQTGMYLLLVEGKTYKFQVAHN